MSSTNKTTYYELPQFVDNDIFNPLVDDNDAYSKIDTALHNIADAEAGDAGEIVSIKSRLDSAEGDIDALEAQNGNNVLTTTAQTLSGAVNELDADIASLDGRVDIVEDDLNNASTGLKAKVSALETQNGNEVLTTTAQNLSGAVNELDADVDSILIKLSHIGFVSVKDYGAIGDGVADDTNAIQTALNENECVVFPVGYYKVTDTIELNNSNAIIGVNKFKCVITMPAGSNKPIIKSDKKAGWSIENLTISNYITPISDGRDYFDSNIINTNHSAIVVDMVTSGTTIFNDYDCAVTMKNINIWYVDGNGIEITGKGGSSKFDNINVRGANGYGFYIHDTFDFSLTNIIAGYCQLNGFYISSCQFINFVNVWSWFSGMRIDRTDVNYPVSGVKLSDSKDISIEGTSYDNSGSGVELINIKASKFSMFIANNSKKSNEESESNNVWAFLGDSACQNNILDLIFSDNTPSNVQSKTLKYDGTKSNIICTAFDGDDATQPIVEDGNIIDITYKSTIWNMATPRYYTITPISGVSLWRTQLVKTGTIATGMIGFESIDASQGTNVGVVATISNIDAIHINHQYDLTQNGTPVGFLQINNTTGEVSVTMLNTQVYGYVKADITFVRNQSIIPL